ncbi:HpcH/HpaI aldolase/citrate lyase family protein [Bradyrhizobium canariense]|uniref:Citrate lyase subunit beta / citryl-CoA lyase n=1 Tax=Bradyrhizobium canariense TaxID=255045 RepID=A0A1H2BSQ2_9BRAD|nr:CoA ester lyase [Bradyrhizobium canariense]SDT60796.1 citrate lyase subunit beta / citryl-CoA lyase [Bradyrhizobium canariense]
MRPLRSLLFAPGNHARRSEKALTLDADAVILDLEDACPVSEKIATRQSVVSAMASPRSCIGYVRVNPLSSDFGYGDIVSVVGPGIDGIVLPKVESAQELCTADWLITQIEREKGLAKGTIDLLPILETGKGFAEVAAIASAGTRAKRLAFGAGDFTLDMDIRWSRDESELMHYRSSLVLASRANGLAAPIDTVWIDMRDAEGLTASAHRARGMGFQGKLCIHPDQVAVVNAAFSPSAEQVAWAQRVVDAFKAAEAAQSSAIQLDGQFIDYPIVYQAQRVLAVEASIKRNTLPH